MKPGKVVQALSILMGLMFIAPIVLIFTTSLSKGTLITFPPDWLSFRWYREILSTDKWTDAFLNSAIVATLAALLSLVVGTLLAIAVSRGRSFIPNSLIIALAVGPLIVPLIVSGVGFYIVAVRIGLTGTVLGLGLAHSSLGIPFVFLNVLAALSKLDPAIEEAARICGAGNLTTFLKVTLPLVLHSAFVGSVLAFILSWDEVVVGQFFNSPTFRTLPVVIYAEVRSGADPSTSAIAVAATVVSILIFAITAVFGVLLRRRRLRSTLV